MTSIPANQQAMGRGRPPQRAAAPPQQGVQSAPTIDPIKIIKKYLWVLVGAGVVGVLLGVGVFFVWVRVAPVWRTLVIFEANPPTADIGRPAIEQQASEDELERFMLTQVQLLTGDALLEQVVGDPRLQAEAPNWYAQFVSENGLFDEYLALRDLTSRIRARTREGTELFDLSVAWKERQDVTGLAGLIREAYMNDVERRENRASSRQEDALRGQIRGYEQQRDELTRRRAQTILEKGISSDDQAGNEAAQTLQILANNISELQGDLIEIRERLQTLRDLRVRIEESESVPDALALPSNPFPEDFQAAVEQQPIIRDLRAQIESIENSLASLRLQGIQPSHRQYRSLQSELDARREKMTSLRQSESLKQLSAAIENLENQEQTIAAQIADFSEQRQELREELTVLTSDLADVEQLDQRIQSLETTLQNRRTQLATLIASNRASRRVEVVQFEREPEVRESPKLPITVAGVFVIVVGAAGSLLFLRELLDQRVKGPSDVDMIPRSRVLGHIPLAAEDPDNPKHFETIFRDQPKGVLAESFRQLRTAVLRDAQRGGHRSVMVFSGEPRSGASSIVTNLAHAMQMVDQKVLVIDANLRRPSLHRTLGVDLEPGLAEVLAGQATLADAVRTSEDGLPLLTAGAREQRVFERLGTAAMARLLEEAKSEYDLVLLDVAPAVVSSDASALSTRVDAAIMVVRAFSEKRGMIARLQNEMNEAHADLLGIVINGIRSAAGGYMRRNIRTAHAYQDRAARDKAAPAAGDNGRASPKAAKPASRRSAKNKRKREAGADDGRDRAADGDQS